MVVDDQMSNTKENSKETHLNLLHPIKYKFPCALGFSISAYVYIDILIKRVTSPLLNPGENELRVSQEIIEWVEYQRQWSDVPVGCYQ